MEADIINPDEITSMACLNKKRKLQDELLVMPSSKHICWDQRLVCDFPCDSTIDSKMVGSNMFRRGVEYEPDFASYSYSFPDYADSSMSSHGDAKTYLSYPKAQGSPKNGSPYTFSDDKSSQIGPYSLESRTLAKGSSEIGSPSICEDLHSLYRDYGLHLTDNYGVRLLEIGGDAACSFTEYRNEVIEGCMDEGVDNQLCLNEATDSNYVLSSGRWSINQDSQETTRKPTIDKEFEQYFSALML